MKRHSLLGLCLALTLLPALAFAATGQEQKIDAFVRDFYLQYQKQNWEAVAPMMHPDWLRQLRMFSLATLPDDSAQVTESNRTKVQKILDTLKVKTVEEARALSDEAVFTRVMLKSQEIEAVARLSKAEVTVENVTQEAFEDGYKVDVEATSKLDGKTYDEASTLIIKPVGDQLKVLRKIKRKSPEP